MAQLKHVREPFGEVNVQPGSTGKTAVRATILLPPAKEGTKTGIALDGSGSMALAYGLTGSGGNVFGSFFGRTKTPPTNQITPVARKVCAYLARKLDADGSTACIYWATGPGGGLIEPVADFTAEQAEQHFFAAPAQFGTGSQLLPAVKHFVERFPTAPYGFFVFVTDGEMHDLEEVKAFTRELAQEIAGGRRPPVKLVLVGVGENVNEEQLAELDDLESAVDLWDYKIAQEMRYLEEIFAEAVDRNARVAASGRILDPHGNVVQDYAATGVPTVLEFEISDDMAYFTLELPDHPLAYQPLREGVELPAVAAVPNPVPAPKAAKKHPTQEEIDARFLEAVQRVLTAQRPQTVAPPS